MGEAQPWYGYRGYGGYWGRKRREADSEAVAEPEAEPWYGYRGYGGYWGRKRRDADSELSLSLRLNHTTMYTILIIPTITLVKDLLMPILNHGMDIEDMADTGVVNVALLKLSHGDMEDMDTVDTGDKIKADDGTTFP